MGRTWRLIAAYRQEGATPARREAPKCSCYPRRLVHHLPVREPNHLVAPQLQVEVTGAVGFESRATAVVAIAVSLDDQAAVPPQKVHEEGTNPDVHCGWRDAVPAAEAQEETLELAAGSIGVATDLESQDLRLANRPPDLLGRRDARQVGQGAGGVGDRNAVATARDRGSQ
jgi:hypothetical protein